MEVKLSKYHSYRNMIKKMLLWCGVWPHLEDTCFFYRIVVITAILMFSTNGIKVFFYGIANAKKVSILVMCLSNLLGQWTMLLKLICFLLYREDLVELDKELGSAFEKELKNKELHPLLLKSISIFRIFLFLESGFVIISGGLLYGIPLLYVFKYKKYIMIYQGKYPFPVEPASPLYWTLLFYETFSMWFVQNVTNGVDHVFGLHCFRACGLLRLGAQRWRELQPNNPRAKQHIRECVQIHQLVMKARDRLQRVYGVIVIWNYVSISLVICSLLWQADQQKHNMTSIKAIFFLCYLGIKGIQAFTYAYFGSLVSRESENYQDAIYFCDWPTSGNVRLMKDLLFSYTQRVITMKACGYFFITMTMFEKILNTSLSYFFLLQTVESKH